MVWWELLRSPTEELRGTAASGGAQTSPCRAPARPIAGAIRPAKAHPHKSSGAQEGTMAAGTQTKDSSRMGTLSRSLLGLSQQSHQPHCPGMEPIAVGPRVTLLTVGGAGCPVVGRLVGRNGKAVWDPKGLTQCLGEEQLWGN